MLKPATFLSDLDKPDSLIYSMLMRAPIAMAFVNEAGDVICMNDRFHALVGKGAANAGLERIQQVFTSINTVRWAKLWQQLQDQERLHTREVLAVAADQPPSLELTLMPVSSKDERGAFIYVQDTESVYQTEGINLLRQEVLESVASGESVNSVMDLLCRRVEALAPEVVCTVLLVDEDGRLRHCAAPSMREDYVQAIDGLPIGPSAGSCGTAAWRGEVVEVTDIAHDPLWENYRELALSHGLAACWSSPITMKNGHVAGTFALYFREPRGASPFHREMVQACLHLCLLAFESEESKQQIYQLAFYDPLTDLPNRSLLWDRAQQSLKRLARERQPLAVLILDLDRFKTINDSLGHSRGDYLLKTVAKRLEQCLRPRDTLARLGGDEFVMLLPGMGSSQAIVVAEKLLASLAVPVMVNTTEVTPTASIGISIAPDDGTDFDTLQKHADLAMYKAKAEGRNTFRFFRPQMNDAVIKRLEMEVALRKAITEKQFVVYYQPQINLKTHELHGLEALVRWRHPELGLVSPASFIPLAEESGLISQIDQQVLEAVCQQRQRWSEQGITVDSVSVNLSVADFKYADVTENVRRVLQRYPLPPESLTLEITESLMLNSAENTLATLESLRALGVKLSVDDFGTGYSSLSYLKRFPVNELKLDRSFVRDLSDDPSDRALANAIIHLGDTFKLTVVAEGVETREQLDTLIDMGCGVAQGYYFAHPMPVDAITHWLTDGPEVF
ncbi:putative bifunctional diguanylate cyclase/phosphodiesterase [Marinobacter caseinilyticus]|uniref:putative bifunctional diguanylate cyclase/phosphodiesterase n=1 Tax=Marinobacter caseinilyticus TaxID=2692195 RepID=UPI001407E1A3|nr:EAL domain-containing protein [Marinobacter caseinilyticus]